MNKKWDDVDEDGFEEEDDDLLCGEWFSPGVEECEFCPHAKLCRELTYASQKKQGIFK